MPKGVIRKAFVMKLLPGCEEEYERLNHSIWVELRIKFKEYGLHNYSIFREGLTLFISFEIEDVARWEALVETPIYRKWRNLLAPLVESNPDNSPITIELREVVHID